MCWCGQPQTGKPRKPWRPMGELHRLPTFWWMDRRELLDLRHLCANPGGGPRRPERWRGPRWWLYPPAR